MGICSYGDKSYKLPVTGEPQGAIHYDTFNDTSPVYTVFLVGLLQDQITVVGTESRYRTASIEFAKVISNIH